jgi:hypothetical protein
VLDSAGKVAGWPAAEAESLTVNLRMEIAGQVRLEH